LDGYKRIYGIAAYANIIPLESYIAPQNITLENGSQILKDDWVMTAKIMDDAIWEDINNGSITAFSPGGPGMFTLLDEDEVREIVA
jgi:hypothetical protein